MSGTVQQVATSGDDALTTAVEKVVIAAAVTLVVLIALPLVIPVVATRVGGDGVATRTGFWVNARWHLPTAIAGVALVTGLVTVELLLLIDAARTDRLVPSWQLIDTLLPWLAANLMGGVLLLPAAWLLHRRRIATRVRSRRIADVIRQTRIETARKRAADATAAHRIGVQVHPASGKITGTRPTATTAPHPTPDGLAFGIAARTTVTTVADRFHDRRKVRDWITRTGDHLVLPKSASAVRALVIAESGSGKTVLMDSLILCALDSGWPVVFLDAKGDPQDATHLAALARGRGKTAQVAGAWDLFGGTADQVTAKLMRLMPPPDGANQHYLDEIRGVLQAVQASTPIRSVDDLRDRLTRPGPHVRDQHDLQLVNQTVDRGSTTSGARVLHALQVALRPLEKYLDPDGWTYDRPGADLVVVPLSPVDDAQARLGDLLLLDLRNYLATRLARQDKSPVLVVVDEFPQLVTDTSDPGDTAGSLFETARSAGLGLILATQSPAGLSNDEIRRRRALTSGAALIFGRSKDPEDVVKYAGTVMQMEASGAAAGDELRSARAQHTFVIPPQDVREAADGAFWLVQGGAIAPFRALPLPTTRRPSHDEQETPMTTTTPFSGAARASDYREPTAASTPPALPEQAPIATVDLDTPEPAYVEVALAAQDVDGAEIDVQSELEPPVDPTSLFDHHETPTASTGIRGLLSRIGVKVRPGAAELAQLRTAEERRSEEATIRQAVWPRAVGILIANRKGGVGKTPTSVILGGILAAIRGGSVAIMEVADDPGTLTFRTEGNPARGIGELAGDTDQIRSAAQLASYTAPQTSFASVIGTTGPRRQLVADDIRRIATVVDEYYGIRIMDSGNQPSSSAFDGALDTTDTLVVPVLNSAESVLEALALLDQLRATGHEHLADTATVLRLTDGRLERPDLVARLDRLLRSNGITRIYDIPYDPHIAERGPITLDRLNPATRTAFTTAAAGIIHNLQLQPSTITQ